MSFGNGSGSGSSIADAADVILSSPATNDYFGYNSSIGKWGNYPLSGKVALATKGGEETVFSNSSVSGAFTVNLINGNVASIALSGNVTFTFANTASNKACSFGMYLFAGGSHTVTWPANVKWPDGVKPTLTGTSTNPDILVFETLNGTVWYGMLAGNNFS